MSKLYVGAKLYNYVKQIERFSLCKNTMMASLLPLIVI